MNDTIKFRMVAFTGAAGKADPAAPMGGNEDNFYVDDNLSDEIPCHFEVDKVLDLAEYGLIMAVADGMGGQNAGEIASGIAVKTVQEFFAPGVLNEKIVATAETRKKYLEQLVIEADKRIKEEAKNNSEHEGMGSTIILAWIIGDKLTLTWCGDSRAYRYNPKLKKIERLSIDHSYVQELVNQGVISYDDTFDHPQGNIVTRSLGERNNKAQPETRQFELYNGDIILLCSDGLSGVLRDHKTYDQNGNLFPGDNIEDIIKGNMSTMKQCKDALWDAAEKADWYDNVTIILCQILDGVKEIDVKQIEKVEKNQFPQLRKQSGFFSRTIIDIQVTPKSIVIFLILVVFLIMGIVLGIRYVPHLFNEKSVLSSNDSILSQSDTIKVVPVGNKYLYLREKLHSQLLQECSDFISEAGLEDIDDPYFDEIKGKIDAITDTVSYKETSAYVQDFIIKAKNKAQQIKTIREIIVKNAKNRNVIRLLNSLIDRCVKQEMSSIDLMKEIDKILPQKEEASSQEGGDGESGGSYDEGDSMDDSPVDGAGTILTPIQMGNSDDNDQWELIIMPRYEEWINQVFPAIRTKWNNKGYEYFNIYKKDKKTVIHFENLKKGMEYQLKFVRRQ